MTEAVLLAPLLVAVVLVLSGASKVGRAGMLADAAADLRVPASLRRPVVLGAVPYAEVALGLAVLLTPGPAAVAPALLAALLLLTYTLLVGRAVLAGDAASCACFGDVEPVTGRTLVRNLLLLAAGAVAVAAATERAPLDRLADLSGVGAGWLVGAVLVGLVVALAVPRGSGPHPGTAPDPTVRGIPFLPVTRADGTVVSLPEMASLRAQLVVHLSDGCDPCRRVTAEIASWPALVPEIDVVVLTKEPLGTPLPTTWPNVVHDPDERVATVLGLPRPSAVLLGADALVAGGPVHGPSAVLDLFAEVREALADGRGQARDQADDQDR